ncbi:serine carboxypeptidase [Naegleria gruberi]|uniref:Serine carboxypeptidase n=1 Tax=Naegleria gruberi TaxID=5762 RepID=D2VD69_NAEGR|nr:serine carboxypeptidase [Naegleria gruberi]EFC45181.1 serine carboxypeptidase [Naegleria gruberi]|eukprot:XP_002677925.1 serine carboxypeptidase [Naegleria gruberi strain NEG-M]
MSSLYRPAKIIDRDGKEDKTYLTDVIHTSDSVVWSGDDEDSSSNNGKSHSKRSNYSLLFFAMVALLLSVYIYQSDGINTMKSVVSSVIQDSNAKAIRNKPQKVHTKRSNFVSKPKVQKSERLYDVVDYVYNCSNDHSVTELPGYGSISREDESLYSFAGHLSVHREDTNKDRFGALFYWFFGRKDSERPIMLWLQGGPSASSMIAAFEEFISPFYISNSTNQLNLHYNNQSWISQCDLLFIDQPVGAGFSYEYPTNDFTTTRHQVSNDLYSVLLNFFDKYPQFRNRDLIFAGESYAGKYLPSLAERVYLLKMEGDEPTYEPVQKHGIHKRLKGIIIGDGFTAPIVQRVLKADQAYWSGLLGYQQRQQLKTLQRDCVRHIQEGNTVELGSACEAVKSYILIASGVINIYDIRTFSPSTDKPRLEGYLNQPDVKKALHILDRDIPNKPEDIKFWSTRPHPVYDYLKADILTDLRDLLPQIAERTKLLLYGGNFDLQDGPQPIERFLLTINDPMIKRWVEAPRNLFFVNNKVAGYEKSSGNFSLVTIFGNGHFVHSQKDSMRALLKKFIALTYQPTADLSFCSESETIPVRFKTLTPSTFLKYLYDNETMEHRIPCQSQQLICEKILKNCNGHGTCVHGYCKCIPGYTGETCENVVQVIPIGYESEEPFVMKQQELFYGKVHLEERKAITTVQVNWRPKEVNEFDQPLKAPNYKYDSVSKPSSKMCLIIKRGSLPKMDDYDKVHCKDSHLDGPLLVVSNSTQTEEMKGRLFFGIVNTQQYEVECELKVLSWNQEYSVFLLDETVSKLNNERNFLLGSTILLLIIVIIGGFMLKCK